MIKKENEFRNRRNPNNKIYLYYLCKKCEKIYKDAHNKKTGYRKLYYKNHPWLITYYSIKARCERNKEHSHFKRGIKNFLTLKDLEYIWVRDRASLLKRPSIHRIDRNNHYTIKNCKYIELYENCREGANITNTKK